MLGKNFSFVTDKIESSAKYFSIAVHYIGKTFFNQKGLKFGNSHNHTWALVGFC